MSYYIKTKFQIGQDIYSIEKDEIKEITCETRLEATEQLLKMLKNNKIGE